MIKYLLLLIPFLLTSCRTYRGYFDCPPGEGVPCASLSEIEDMIIESEEGQNVFLGEDFRKGPKEIDGTLQPRPKKVWISEMITEDGQCIQGHYILIDEESWQ